MSLAHHQLAHTLDSTALHTVVLPHAAAAHISYRSVQQAQGAITPVVLLHGIGSNAGSWVLQLHAHLAQLTLAWNAPGYEGSTALAPAQPQAADYAQQLWAWLDALHIEQVHLVGHSLGCIMAASAARLHSHRVASLSLLSPAQGYGTASAELRHDKRNSRLQLLNTLGVQGMAQARGAKLVSDHASPDLQNYAIAMMARINIPGYTQATELLSHADIHADLAVWCTNPKQRENTYIACGTLDTITPHDACAALAKQHGVGFTSIVQAGHLAALEQATQVNAWLSAHIHGNSPLNKNTNKGVL